MAQWCCVALRWLPGRRGISPPGDRCAREVQGAPLGIHHHLDDIGVGEVGCVVDRVSGGRACLFGVLDDPTTSYEGANPLCGDRITMMLGIKDGVVSEVAFTGRGCAISQASASLLTDEIKGKTVEEVEKMTPDDLLHLIGIEISPARLKCALLSLDTVAHALADEAAAHEEAGTSQT